MIRVLKSDDRITSDHGTVAIRRTFTQGNPRDPNAGGIGPLISIAETYIAPASGFPMHPHRDMEIVSFMADGAMAHRDTLGNGTVIGEGEIQRMSAGTGIVHSEFNPSDNEACRCLQIWILPSQAGLDPSYEQKKVPVRDGIIAIAAPDATGDAVAIHQDVTIHAVRLAPGASAGHSLSSGRCAYIQLAHGKLNVNGTALIAGDGASIDDETAITLSTSGDEEARALLFDVKVAP
jgi:redox-sensitive bicupin YhaK (pirin superfamily)